ncbi:MAG: SoxR reducing system RseC family protein [Bacteroidales bacterium]|nr:SoxR reducing system RseC family protein [Bacteroidales bacterium]
MEASVCIEQEGIVEEITNHGIRVRLHRDSACGQCGAHALCNLSDVSERIIEAADNSMNLKTGDVVGVSITRSMGNKAVILGYLAPFVLLVTMLIILNSLGFNELLSGLVSISVLIPYYLLIYMLRDRLKNSFYFTVRKKELQ